MQIVKALIDDVLADYNDTLKQEGLNYKVYLRVDVHKKKFMLNRKDFYEKKVAEMFLIQKGEPSLMLWQKQMIMPDKVEGKHPRKVEDHYVRLLYYNLFFEAMGSFCALTKGLITNQDYAEWDIEKNRMKNHPGSEGMVIKAISGGEFYEKENEFDVFMHNEEFYWVYTAHDIGMRNNGIAKIPIGNAMVLQLPKPRIIGLDELRG